MTAQDLKNSILQLAVQGKLVPQDPSDEPASELLKRIYAEKTIKRQKKATEIIVEDIPFDIPDTWEWIKFGDLGELKNGYAFKSAEYKSSGVQVVRISDLGDGNIESKNAVYYEESIDLQQYLIPTNAFLICMTGSIGKMAWVRDSQSRYLNQRVGLFCPHSVLNHSYLWLFLHSPYVINRWVAGKTSLNGNIKNSDITDLPCPIPPLAEQERIVAKIEELLPLIERYGEAEERLKELNTEFPDKLRKSILQQAVQGKLTERDPADEPASELLKRIRAEKAKLIAEGKIKKEKPLPPITDEEKPFEIPDTWEWVRLSDVIDVRDGTHDTPKYITSGYPLITGKDFYNGYFQLDKTQYISEADYLEIIKRSKVDIGDILFSMIGGNIGSMIRITTDNYFEMGIKNVALFKQYMENETLSCYLFYFLKSQIERMRKSAKGGAQPFVPLNLLRSYPFPLPPLAEQKRIVARVEELLAVCDGLK